MTENKKSILCVDDDHDDHFLIRESIQRMIDINIERAFNGLEALKILENRKVSNELPCLVITDINMPKMDGNALVLAIRADEVLQKIPIVIFTTSVNKSVPIGVDGQPIPTIIKPTDWSSYEDVVKEILQYCR